MPTKFHVHFQKPVSVREKIILNQQSTIEKLQKEVTDLKMYIEKQTYKFGIEKFCGQPENISFYTGLPDYLTFITLCDFLEPAKHRLQSLYYKSKGCAQGRHPTLSIHNELFLTLCRLRQGYAEKDLAERFDISESTVGDICMKWIKHMSHMLQQLPIWPSKESIIQNSPNIFAQAGYRGVRVIIDCTEIFIQCPSNIVLQCITFSNYKSHHTAKALIGITPSGAVSFVSDLYVGSVTDKDITRDCGILDLCEPGDQIMADKGFEIQDLCDEHQIRVDHPPILRNVKQMNEVQEKETRSIARLRIHVERLIERVKNFKILQLSVPISICRLLPDIWKVCALLTLFMPPIIDD